MRLSVQRLTFAALTCSAWSCSGSPAAPSQAATAVTGVNQLAGTLVQTVAGTPVSGATIAFSLVTATGTFTASVGTDGAGHFAVSNVPNGIVFATITAVGYIDRRALIAVAGDQTQLVLDVIQDAAPFSLPFYRQFARNGWDSSTLVAIRPWTMAPSFYVRTVTDDTGEAIAQSTLTGVQRVIMNAVPELTGGRYSVATYEMGAEARADQTGLVRVVFLHDRSLLGSGSVMEPANQVSGTSTVGGNFGLIKLLYDPAIDAQGLNNLEHCESMSVGTADHEIVHAMGFWHTATTFDDFLSGPGCPGRGRSAAAVYHAAVMYSRLPGNLDEDEDVVVLPSVTTLRPPSAFFSSPFPRGR